MNLYQTFELIPTLSLSSIVLAMTLLMPLLQLLILMILKSLMLELSAHLLMDVHITGIQNNIIA
jgi:hypothetical protein